MQGNYIVLVAAIFGVVKLVLNQFGIVIPDNLINDLVNGISAVVTIVGIFLNNHKPKELPDKITNIPQ